MIAWQGPSEIDSSPVVLIVTGLDGGSTNPKTGPMAQGWILRSDMPPAEALATGADVSICGGCKHRPRRRGTKPAALGSRGMWGSRSCYVHPRGLQSIYRAYVAGHYPALDTSAFDGQLLRMGGYGDPAAVPEAAWQLLLDRVAGWTGYTHQWRNPRYDFLQAWCMASVDTPEEMTRATLEGWGTFRVLTDYEEPLAAELVCPASHEAGRTTTCAECLRCNGAASSHVTIRVHGSGRIHFRNGQLELLGR